MKRIIIVFFVAVLCAFSVRAVYAEETLYDVSGIYDSLSDEAREHMLAIGADGADADSLSSLSFESILNEILAIGSQNAQSPLKGLITVTAMLLICSMLSAYRGALSSDVGGTMNTVLSLCIGASVAVPAAGLIQNAADIVVNASNLMLAYIPVIALLLTASGSVSGSAAYYTAVLGAGEGVSQLSSQVIVPFMRMLLGMSIAGGVSSEVYLSGFVHSISKMAKWLLGFGMAIFTAVIGLKQVLASALDTVTGRAARMALSSFVPIVGSALAEALKTVQGSVTVLKSGIGVFVILALAVTFLPSVVGAILWQVTLWAGKSVAEALNLPQGARLLESLSDVFATLMASLLSVMTVYIIITAMIFSMGGAS